MAGAIAKPVMSNRRLRTCLPDVWHPRGFND